MYSRASLAFFAALAVLTFQVRSTHAQGTIVYPTAGTDWYVGRTNTLAWANVSYSSSEDGNPLLPVLVARLKRQVCEPTCRTFIQALYGNFTGATNSSVVNVPASFPAGEYTIDLQPGKANTDANIDADTLVTGEEFTLRVLWDKQPLDPIAVASSANAASSISTASPFILALVALFSLSLLFV